MIHLPNLKKKKLELISMNEETLRVVDDEDWKVDETITADEVRSVK